MCVEAAARACGRRSAPGRATGGTARAELAPLEHERHAPGAAGASRGAPGGRCAPGRLCVWWHVVAAHRVHPVAVGPALHVLRVRAAVVALQRRVAGRMAVHAARVLQHPVDDVPGRERVASSRRAARAARRPAGRPRASGTRRRAAGRARPQRRPRCGPIARASCAQVLGADRQAADALAGEREQRVARAPARPAARRARRCRSRAPRSATMCTSTAGISCMRSMR